MPIWVVAALTPGVRPRPHPVNALLRVPVLFMTHPLQELTETHSVIGGGRRSTLLSFSQCVAELRIVCDDPALRHTCT